MYIYIYIFIFTITRCVSSAIRQCPYCSLGNQYLPKVLSNYVLTHLVLKSNWNLTPFPKKIPLLAKGKCSHIDFSAILALSRKKQLTEEKKLKYMHQFEHYPNAELIHCVQRLLREYTKVGIYKGNAYLSTLSKFFFVNS